MTIERRAHADSLVGMDAWNPGAKITEDLSTIPEWAAELRVKYKAELKHPVRKRRQQARRWLCTTGRKYEPTHYFREVLETDYEPFFCMDRVWRTYQ